MSKRPPSKIKKQRLRNKFNRRMRQLGVPTHARRGYAIGFMEHLTGRKPDPFSWYLVYLMKDRFREDFENYVEIKRKKE